MSASATVGTVGGAAWLTIWIKCGTPIGPVFLASFILGALFASILAFTPLGKHTGCLDSQPDKLINLSLKPTHPSLQY